MSRGFWIFLVCLVAPLAAIAQPISTPRAQAEVIAERTSVVPGDRFLGALHLDLEEGGWHVYWKNPGDSGLPPEVEWTLPEGVEVDDFVWPVPHPIRVGDLMNYGYEHELVLPFDIRIADTFEPGDVIELNGDASWLICLETCIPESADVSLTITVGSTPVPDTQASSLISAALSSVPQPLMGGATFERTADAFKISALDSDLSEAVGAAKEVRFIPDTHALQHAAEQTIRRGDAGVQFEALTSDYADDNIETFGGVVFVQAKNDDVAGWRVDAMPGAMPAGVADTAVGSGGAGSPFGFVELMSFLGAAFLGGLILNLMPCVLPVLSIKAASLVQHAHEPAEARKHGLAYLGGVLVCFVGIGIALVALRSAGQSVGLGFQLQYPPMIAFFALLMFAVGLNLLGVFNIGSSVMGVGSGLVQKSGTSGAFFTGLLAGLVGAPCVGPFMATAVGVALSQPAPVVLGVFAMIGVGLAAPLVLISFTPALARLLPKPGAWMETFRQILAFPMFITAIWLLWVLAGQAGSDAVILVVAGATVLGFGIWLSKKVGDGRIGKAVAGLVVLAAFFGPAVGSSMTAAPSAVEGGASGEYASEAWSRERVAELRAEGRPVFVDFTARWCVTCQLNKVAIHSSKVGEAFADGNVAFLIADWTNRDEVIAAALAEYDRVGVPLYLMYPADGGEAEVLPQLLTSGVIESAVRRAVGPPAA